MRYSTGDRKNRWRSSEVKKVDNQSNQEQQQSSISTEERTEVRGIFNTVKDIAGAVWDKMNQLNEAINHAARTKKSVAIALVVAALIGTRLAAHVTVNAIEQILDSPTENTVAAATINRDRLDYPYSLDFTQEDVDRLRELSDQMQEDVYRLRELSDQIQEYVNSQEADPQIVSELKALTEINDSLFKELTADDRDEVEEQTTADADRSAQLWRAAYEL